MFGRKYTTASLAAALSLVALIGGCRGEATTGSSYVPSAEFASALRSLAGDVQTGPVALPLPQALTVRVVDAGGRAVQGASVNWTVLGGGGTVNPPTGVSNADGLVTTTWTLGTSLGAHSVRAYLSRGYLLDSATFSATAIVGAPTSVLVDSTAIPVASAMVASTVSNVRFVVRDQFGYKVPSASVSFAVTAGGGSVSPATATTDTNGAVSAAFTMGTLVGTNTMRATVAGLTPAAVTVASTVDTSRVLTRIAGNSQANVPVGTPHQAFVVQVGDRFGNLTVGDTVSWTILAGGGSVSPTRVLAGTDSRAATVWTAGPVPSAGRVRAYLTRGTLRDSMDFVSTIVAGQATSFRVDSATVPAASLRVTTQTAGIRFVVRDALGLPVPGATVTFGSTGAASAVSPASAVSTADGIVSTSWTLGTQVGAQTLTATLGALPPVVLSVTATPDTSRRLTIVGGNGQTAAASGLLGLPLVVSVKDQYGNPIAGELVTFADSLGGGVSLNPTSALTNASGQAETSLRLGNGLGIATVRVRIAAGTPEFHIQRFNATATMTFRDVYAGNYFACGIGINDRAYCWGFGEDGQLGNAGLASTNAPQWPVSKSDGSYPTFREIAGGRSHTCAVSVARTIFCWGLNVEGRTFVTVTAPTRTPTATEPQTPIVNNARTASAGEAHSCMLTMGGVPYCSGNNDRGQLGDGSFIAKTAQLVDTVGPLPEYWSAIVSGERHTCGMPRLASAELLNLPGVVRPSQQIWCWGANERGQLGNGTVRDTARADTVAFPILTIPVVGFDSTSIVAGANHTCALEAGEPTNDRRAFCWGSNAFGQLGKGDSISAAIAFTTPRLVADQGFVRLAAGEYHSCGLTSTGAAYCWGRNDQGQLSGSISGPVSAPSLVPGVPPLRSLVLGEFFTCGITGVPGAPGTTAPGGVIWCWGNNEFGQLGRGVFTATGAVLAPAPIWWQ